MYQPLPKTSPLIAALSLTLLCTLFSVKNCPAAPKSLNEAFAAAAVKNDLPQIKRLLQKGANVNYVDAYGATALNYAAMHNHLATFKVLLKAGASPNPTSPHEETNLILACEEGSYPIARLLLQRNVDVNIFDGSVPHEQTPLMYAAKSGNARLIELLIGHGANVNLANNDGDTPLMYVKNAASAKLLIDHGADVNARTEWDGGVDTPLRNAVERKNIDVIRMLIDHGADVNAFTGEWPIDTILKTAVADANVVVVELLLAHGARVHDKHDAVGKTPIEIAREVQVYPARARDYRKIIILLKQAGERK